MGSERLDLRQKIPPTSHFSPLTSHPQNSLQFPHVRNSWPPRAVCHDGSARSRRYGRRAVPRPRMVRKPLHQRGVAILAAVLTAHVRIHREVGPSAAVAVLLRCKAGTRARQSVMSVSWVQRYDKISEQATDYCINCIRSAIQTSFDGSHSFAVFRTIMSLIGTMNNIMPRSAPGSAELATRSPLPLDYSLYTSCSGWKMP